MDMIRLALVSLGILGTEQTDNHAGMTLDMRNIDFGRLRYCLKDYKPEWTEFCISKNSFMKY